MSEIAGRMSVQEGAKYLEKPQGGRGVLLGGLPGVAPVDVVILGAGVVGLNAANIAAGMGASVHLVDIDVRPLRHADAVMPANVSPQRRHIASSFGESTGIAFPFGPRR